MSEPRMIDPERLLAWHHGALPQAEARALEAALPADAGARALLEDWRAQDAALAALYAPVAKEPVPAHLAAITRPAPLLPRLARIAALIGMLALGLAGGWFGARMTPAAAPGTGMARAAIAAHETYAVEVVHPVEVEAAQADHLTGWVSKRLGQQIAPPDFAAQGFHLMGGRVLPGEAGTAAMFMYENDLGARISLYVAPSGTQTETAFQFAERDGLQSFWWVDRDLSYAVVGAVPREALRALALDAYDQLI